ncbi:hypothetical protein M3Y98_00251200 [Aphelenchoides besseyi]|nr:hypothetical protein M3Y98_00251200 [Aphelenchoides besseyi]KAI6200775.1 hypothetical protein M3Y96_00770100 [Aphelenchoides besseyi]
MPNNDLASSLIRVDIIVGDGRRAPDINGRYHMVDVSLRTDHGPSASLFRFARKIEFVNVSVVLKHLLHKADLLGGSRGGFNGATIGSLVAESVYQSYSNTGHLFFEEKLDHDILFDELPVSPTNFDNVEFMRTLELFVDLYMLVPPRYRIRQQPGHQLVVTGYRYAAANWDRISTTNRSSRATHEQKNEHDEFVQMSNIKVLDQLQEHLLKLEVASKRIDLHQRASQNYPTHECDGVPHRNSSHMLLSAINPQTSFIHQANTPPIN